MRDLTGQKFNKLQVIDKASSSRAGHIRWNCVCECGNSIVVSTDHLTRKRSPVKSCGCLRKLKGKDHKDWKGCGDISGDWWFSHVKREINQKKRPKVGVTVTIEKAWELFCEQDKCCALSGVPIQIASVSAYNTASLDRIDSSKGYDLDNIQWVHKDVNFMKRTYSQDYFIGLCKKIAEKNK